jgi:light-regulated signal transduction histidine kinase (bacteriophytochrome)
MSRLPLSQPDGSVDLTTCDREPIHIPGSIQSQGCLLACDPASFVVRRRSANAAEMLQARTSPLLNRPLADVIGAEAAHAAFNALAKSVTSARAGLSFGHVFDNGAGTFDIAAHNHGGHAIFEFLPSPDPAGGGDMELVRAVLHRLSAATDIDALLRATPRLLQEALGYDRVMIYQFSEDGAGKVVAESRRGGLESFLGQWFPASDIPQQARALYVKNIIRVIADAQDTGCAIEPARDASGEPLDLSFAQLRSVSPIHLEYLRNMGVRASMSVSIIVDGALWGLIACHNYSPHPLSLTTRLNAELFGQFFSMQVQTLHQRRALAAAAQARRKLDALFQGLAQEESPAQLFGENISELAAIIRCDGLAVDFDGQVTLSGQAPSARVVRAIARRAHEQAPGQIWATHSLPSHMALPEEVLGSTAGVLAVPLSQLSQDYVLFFRQEVVRTIDWAGDPHKQYETGPLGDRLTPRKSFAIWQETVRGQSVPWEAFAREAAETLRVGMMEVIMRQGELLAEERRKAEIRQKRLNDELNHRVKNILALIRSLVRQGASEKRPMGDYIEALEGRILALSIAHDQVLRGDGGGSLAALVGAECQPYLSRAQLDGPDVALDARAYSVLALVIHELMTNAAKYGALSRSTGKLEVSWSLTEECDCVINWRETGGPLVSPPSKRGFGATLVDRAVPYDLGGSSQIDYHPDGVRARLLIPSRYVRATPILVDTGLETEMKVEPESFRGEQLLKDWRVLLVEDQLVIALEAEACLGDLGAAAVDTAATESEALAAIRRAPPDFAVLDVNLGGAATSIGIAQELARRGIRFIFATGYGDSTMLPDEMKGCAVVRKPYNAWMLAQVIEQALKADPPG